MNHLLPPAAPLLGAVAWSVAAQGGTRVLDLVVVTALVLLAFLWSGVRAGEVARALQSPVSVAGAALVAWLGAVGLAQAGPGMAVLRPLWLIVVVTLVAATADRLTSPDRVLVMGGLVAIGVVLAASAVVGWTAALAGDEALPIRASTMLGYPNGAGMVLVATGLVTLHLHREGRISGGWLGALLTVQALGVLATGSRLALLAALAATALVAWRHRTPRVLLASAGVAVPAIALLLQRFATSRPERVDLWRSAAAEIGARPLLGRGPSPELIGASLAGRPTTHVHDELLQVAVEFGLPALALTLVVVALLAVRLARRPLCDIHLGVACAGLASLALTDFALRITAVALVLAVVVPLAWSSTVADPAEEPVRAAGPSPRMPAAAGCARNAAS